MEHIMDTHKPALQVQLVSSLANTLKNLKRSHKVLMQLPHSCKMQIASAHQHSVPHSMLLVPVVSIKVPLLVLSGLLKVGPGFLQQGLYVLNEVSGTSLVVSLHHHI